MSEKSQKLFHKRKHRNRFTLKSKSTLGHRLSVYRSNANIYVQLIDDKKGSTILACSSLDKNIKKITKNNGGNIKAAELVGLNIAKKAKEKGIKKVCFDRGGYIYHGRVKALADSARKEGLNF